MKISQLPPYLYKSSMPNLCQTDRRSTLLDKKGTNLCVPVATSNILIHLAKKHFQMLIPPLGTLSALEAQFKLVEQLIKLMKTDFKSGTYYKDALEGIKKYTRDRGYRVSGWVEGGLEDSCGQSSEKLLLKAMASTLGTSNTLPCVSFFKFVPESKKYVFIDSHCLALAGFVRKEKGYEFIVHDPSPVSKRLPIRCKLTEIPDGSFKWNNDEETDAASFIELQGLAIHERERKRGANKVVLDEVLSFNVHHK